MSHSSASFSSSAHLASSGAQFTCFTSTKVQILTPEELLLLSTHRQRYSVYSLYYYKSTDTDTEKLLFRSTYRTLQVLVGGGVSIGGIAVDPERSVRLCARTGGGPGEERAGDSKAETRTVVQVEVVVDVLVTVVWWRSARGC